MATIADVLEMDLGVTADDRLVVTTLVSSSLLGRMAEAAGVHSEETFTGFKWIGKIASERPDQRLVLGYEQALGYLVAPRPLDKDGITAAVAAGAGSEVDHAVRGTNDLERVLDEHHRVAVVADPREHLLRCPDCLDA